MPLGGSRFRVDAQRRQVERFVQVLPIDREEFIEGFPAYLRQSTDPAEARRFLDDILDLVRETEGL